VVEDKLTIILDPYPLSANLPAFGSIQYTASFEYFPAFQVTFVLALGYLGCAGTE
jgi:hypothetical protein